jgi:SprB repeat
MKKILLILFVVFSCVHSYAQKPVVKVEQYKVIIDRSFYKKDVSIIAYQSASVTIPNGGFPPTFNTCNGASSYTDDASISATGSADLKLYINNSTNTGTVLYKPFTTPFLSMNEKDTVRFVDSVYVYQPQYNIVKITSDAITKRFPNPSEVSFTNLRVCNGALWNDSFKIKRDFVSHSEVNLPGSFFEQTIQGGLNDVFGVTTKITVQPNLDLSYSLPSHDKILVKGIKDSSNQNPDQSFNTVWEYAVFNPLLSLQNQNYTALSSQLSSPTDPTKLYVSGVDIFGPVNYVNYLHKTILIRVRNTINNQVSSPVSFFHRLSAPHIVSVTPKDLNCFNQNDGSFKIQFDRALLQGEKLNILALDTVSKTNYSSFNISKFDNTNAFTWRNELRQGTYFISLIGKFANGIINDLDVPVRDTSIKKYEALNSINFLDGFNTPRVDNFEAVADYSAYSEVAYTGSPTHTKYPFPVITQPDQIKFTVRVDSNVLCKGSEAGVITLAVSGGQNYPSGLKYYKYSLKHQDSANYKPFVRFTNTTPGFVNIPPADGLPQFYSPAGIIEKIRNLRAGTYNLRVRDSVNCIVRDSSGNELTFSFTITEPAKGITLDLFTVTPITSVDSANGKLHIKITGGTPFVPGERQRVPYDVILTDTVTKLRFALSDSIRILPGDTMEAKAKNIPEGVYSLEVQDAYYNLLNSPYNSGCKFIVYIDYKKPAPLMVDIRPRKGISCTNDKDGELVATAKGGIRNDTTGYQFKWYRLVEGAFVQLPGTDTTIKITDSLIRGLGVGRYRVLITDKYGNTKSDTFDLQQPTQMQLTLATTPASCYSSPDGTMQVTSVTGGTPFIASGSPKYTYEWSNGELTNFADSVRGGKYIVVVRDSLGCLVVDSVEVTSPVRIITTNTITQISCYNSNDGAIQINASGGAGSYSYLWNTGNITSAISGLAPGQYSYSVTDANRKCFEVDTIELVRPDTILVNLGDDRKLCLGQTLRLNGTPPNISEPLTYSWTGTGGFTANTPKVNIVNAGTYTLAVSNTTGCTLKDTIVVTRLDSTVNTDFIVSTQAFKNDRVILVSLSAPYPQDSVKWIIPKIGNTIQVLSQSDRTCELVFADTGRYELAMKVYYKSGCIDDTVKYINIINRDGVNLTGNQANAFLKEAKIVPNPNTGVFELRLTFNEATRAKVRLINTLTNLVVDSKEVTIPNSSMYAVPYNLPGTVLNGIYVLVIETPKGSFVYKVVIAR